MTFDTYGHLFPGAKENRDELTVSVRVAGVNAARRRNHLRDLIGKLDVLRVNCEYADVTGVTG